MTQASRGLPRPPALAGRLPRAAGWLLGAVLLVCLGCGNRAGDAAPGAPPATPAPLPPAGQAGNSAPTQLAWQYPAYSPPDDWTWALPPHMPPPRVPADNPMNAAKVRLGRWLFHDPRLSGDGTQSCASCHEQHRAFSDGKARPSGITGMLHPRNAIGLANVAYHATQNWANPAILSLERQIPNPVFGTEPVEMGVDARTVDAVLERLRQATEVDYPALFRAAFPDIKADPLSWETVFKAISAFERTMISANSRYDRYLQGKASLTPEEERGLAVFESAQCSACHQAPNFDDQFVSTETRALTVRYHNIGLYNLDGQGAYPAPNTGAEEITGNPADMGSFRTPSLRNVAVTAPYMHDGSVATLSEAIDILTGGGRLIEHGPLAGDGRTNPHKSPLIRDRRLSSEDKAALLAFLHTLTDEAFLNDPALSSPFPPSSPHQGSLHHDTTP